MAISPTPFDAKSDAGLIAGTTPTTGIDKFSRKEGSTMVLAVLQAMTTMSTWCSSTNEETSRLTREMSTA
ncbi:hypothetical protein AT1219_150057 [Vibrio alginolyticus]